MASGTDAVEPSETKPERGLSLSPQPGPARGRAWDLSDLRFPPSQPHRLAPPVPHSSAREKEDLRDGFTARPSSRSQDTPGREWGMGWRGRGGPQGKAQHRGLASLRPRLSAPAQETLRERLGASSASSRARPPSEHADALRDQVSAGLGSSPRCWQGGASGLGSWLLREGQGDAHSPAWLLSAELARQPRAPPAQSKYEVAGGCPPRRDAGLPGTGGAGRAVSVPQWVAGAGASFTECTALRACPGRRTSSPPGPNSFAWGV